MELLDMSTLDDFDNSGDSVRTEESTTTWQQDRVDSIVRKQQQINYDKFRDAKKIWDFISENDLVGVMQINGVSVGIGDNSVWMNNDGERYNVYFATEASSTIWETFDNFDDALAYAKTTPDESEFIAWK